MPAFLFLSIDASTTEIYILSLHDALPICECRDAHQAPPGAGGAARAAEHRPYRGHAPADQGPGSVPGAGHHDALRAVTLPRLLRGAPVPDEQAGRLVRAGFSGSRTARCRE